MKKSLQKITALALTASCALANIAVASVSAKAFDNNIKSGVVAVVFHLEDVARYATDGENYVKLEDLSAMDMSGGSGFFVGSSDSDTQYVVTNCHVIEDYINADEGGVFAFNTGNTTTDGYPIVIGSKKCEMRIYYSKDDYDIAYVDCYGDVDKVDLAVLRLREPTDKRHSLKLLAPTEDMVGDTVYTIGFPGNADNELSSASQYGVDDVTVHKGSINRFVMNEGKGVERIAVDATIQHGNSGGPLVTEDGAVIGVNTNYVTNESSERDYYSISGTELMRFLDKNNIPYQTMSAGSSGSGAGAGIAVGAVVLVGAGAGVYFATKKKSETPKLSTPVATGSPTAPKKAFIRSMSAQHNGKIFPVSNQPITVGRAGCEIAYAEGTAGVSGKHCTISFNPANRTFTLTDIGSTYGTFLMNGQKLTPNTPVALKAGESFYVGDKANVLRVEMES